MSNKTVTEQQAEYIRSLIKGHTSLKSYTIKKLVKELNEKYNRSASVQAFSGKLKRGTFLLAEFFEILEILGYEMKIEDKRKP